MKCDRIASDGCKQQAPRPAVGYSKHVYKSAALIVADQQRQVVCRTGLATSKLSLDYLEP